MQDTLAARLAQKKQDAKTGVSDMDIDDGVPMDMSDDFDDSTIRRTAADSADSKDAKAPSSEDALDQEFDALYAAMNHTCSECGQLQPCDCSPHAVSNDVSPPCEECGRPKPCKCAKS